MGKHDMEAPEIDPYVGPQSFPRLMRNAFVLYGSNFLELILPISLPLLDHFVIRPLVREFSVTHYGRIVFGTAALNFFAQIFLHLFYIYLWTFAVTMIAWASNEAAEGNGPSFLSIFSMRRAVQAVGIELRVVVLGILIYVPFRIFDFLLFGVLGVPIVLGDGLYLLLLLTFSLFAHLVPIWVLEDLGLLKSLARFDDISGRTLARNTVVAFVFLVFFEYMHVLPIRIEAGPAILGHAQFIIKAVLTPLLISFLVLIYRDSLARNSGAGQRMDEAETM